MKAKVKKSSQIVKAEIEALGEEAYSLLKIYQKTAKRRNQHRKRCRNSACRKKDMKRQRKKKKKKKKKKICYRNK